MAERWKDLKQLVSQLRCASDAPGRARLPADAAAQRVANFPNVSRQELMMFARVTGHAGLHELSFEDLCTINREISEYIDIPHA